MPFIFLGFLLVAVVVVIINVRIVPQAYAHVIERLGSYSVTWGTGFHIKMPFIDRVARVVMLKEQVLNSLPQPVITKDNVTVQIDTVVFFQVTDAKQFSYGIDDPISSIDYLTSTTLRNIVGELELDETLTSRDLVNTKMRSLLDEATDRWGIKVNRVELKNIIPPKEIQDAMEKQMKAERERRESILRAEGEKTSVVLVAEGNKQSAILNAQAEKESVILRAEAAKEAAIREAEGEAEAIRKVQEAKAQGIIMLNRAGVTKGVLTLRSLEAFEHAADGRATKIIIPSDLQNFAGLAASLKELMNDNS
ncbi:MAG: SPFH/Band 7/PHB domain protein [Oscillospiraceae bacterium]|nr:SPFH/Band 7/PHB domain protein [Oscillospiraceae bacterium]